MSITSGTSGIPAAVTRSVIARRHNADGHRIEWRDDGTICAVGTTTRSMSRSAATLLMSEICLYATGEFGRACDVAKRAVAQTHLLPLEYFRATMAGKRIKYGRSAWGHVAAIHIIEA